VSPLVSPATNFSPCAMYLLLVDNALNLFTFRYCWCSIAFSHCKFFRASLIFVNNEKSTKALHQYQKLVLDEIFGNDKLSGLFCRCNNNKKRIIALTTYCPPNLTDLTFIRIRFLNICFVRQFNKQFTIVTYDRKK
jgi:hypothetical protein